jgi:2-keto-4-pentenoate hydratase
MTSLAVQLLHARRSGTVIDPARIERPKDLAAAYAIQQEIVSLSGEPARGFKVGSTSIEAQRKLGTSEPGSGVLLASCVHESPAIVAVSPAHAPCVEGEFSFLMGRDLLPRGARYAMSEVAAAVEAVAGAVEVVGTRFAGGLAGKGRLLVTADCGANIAFVSGAWHRDWRSLDLKNHRAAMSINGTTHGSGTGSRALGDPINVMLWLANHQSAAGRGLKAGEIVSTGTCTGLDPVEPGDRVRADFGPLGSVDIVFEHLQQSRE